MFSSISSVNYYNYYGKRNNNPPKDPKRVLCIDDAGVTGLFPLLFLEELEKRLQESKEKLASHFHLMCGTGSGAVLVFLIGLLGRSISEIKDPYIQFLKEAYNVRWLSPSTWYGRMDTIKKALLKLLGTEFASKKMSEFHNKESPHVFLVTTVILNTKQPYLIQSYHTREIKEHPGTVYHEGESGLTILDALTATCTPYDMWNSTMKSDNIELAEGGLVAPNPIHFVPLEMHHLFPKDDEMDLILSLGTGYPPPLRRDTMKVTRSSFLSRERMYESDKSHVEFHFNRILFSNTKYAYYYRICDHQLFELDSLDVSKSNIQAIQTRTGEFLDSSETKKALETMTKLLLSKR